MTRADLPRFAHGSGEPPCHLAQVRSAAGELRFAGGGRPDTVFTYPGEPALAGLLARLLSARVPLGRDHRIDGPAERAERLLEAGLLRGGLGELGWRGPGQWTLREWWPGAVEWRESEVAEIARLDFDPAGLGVDKTA